MQVEHYENIVCIQIERNERAGIVRRLLLLEQQGGAAPFPTASGKIICILSDVTFQIDCTDLNNIVLTLPRRDLRCLIEAIDEHISRGDEYPLDHPFEPQGATIIPEAIHDVVLETID